MEYCIVLRTSNLNAAGTDADVEIQLLGTVADSQWLVLDNKGDDREKGDIDIYYVNTNDVGDAQKIRVKAREEAATPDGPPWHLDRVSVRRGKVPDSIKALLKLPIGNSGTKKRMFENAFRELPDTRVHSYDDWIIPGKFDQRGTPKEWTVVEMP